MDHNELAAPMHHPNGSGGSILARSHEIGAAYPMQWHSRDPEEEGFISPRFLVRVFYQWWYITLPISCVLAVVSCAVVILIFTPVYRSTAVVKIASYTPYIAYTINEQPMKPEEFTETQIELLRSELVIEQLLAKPEIAEMTTIREQENPVGWLSNRVRVDQVGNSELYYVYLDAPNPEDSALLVNSILEEYFAVRQRDQESQTTRVLELLKQEKDLRGVEIQRLREKVRELGKNMIGADPLTGMPDREKRIMGPLTELGDRLASAQLERKMLEMEITAIRETMAQQDVEVNDVEIEVAVSDTPEIKDLRALIASKKATLHQIENASASGKDASSYRRLEREIEFYESSLASAATQARPLITEQLETMAALDRQDFLKQLETELELKTALEGILSDRYSDQLALAGQSGDQLLELEFVRAELAREEKVFETIANRSMELTTESRAPGRVALLREAEPAAGPVENLPLRNLAAAILLSGCLPFGLALLWELSVRRISDADQLAQQASLPVVGEVAKLPMRLQTITPGGNRAVSLFEESIDSLRVGLVLPDQYQHMKVIAVTSAVHNEGKSSISSQLAVSIGRSCSEPVLLIDGDLRAPDVHHIFEVSNDLGLAAVLDGRSSLDEAIITTWSENIHLLPAGRLRKSPHKLMNVGVLTKLLDELRGRYRYIVIDTPPILSASEALMLAKVADGTVLSTRRNVSRENQVRAAYDRLMKAGAQPLGAVFNGVPTRGYAQTYGSYDYACSID